MVVETVLSDYLGLTDTNSRAELYRRIADIMALPVQVERQVRSLPDVNHDLLLEGLSGISDFLAKLIGNLDERITHFHFHEVGTPLHALAICAEFLHHLAPEKVIAEEKLPDLISLVREVIDAVADDSHLPPEIRQILIDRLREVEDALLFFRISGYSGVQEAMEKLTGMIVSEPATRTSKTDNWLKKLWANITIAIMGVKELSEGADLAMKSIEAVTNKGQ